MGDVLETLWINGSLVPAVDACISAVDHGITVGDGVFETMAVINGKPFAMTRHLRRLARSAEMLRLAVPYDDDTIRAAVDAVLGANDTAGRVRITLTGGVGPLGSGRIAGNATMIVAASPTTDWPPTTTLLVVPWKRNEFGALAGIKSTSYAENVIALDYAHEHGAGEAIFANTSDNLCEGTGTNIFVGVGGRLITPPLSSGCLAGITRELIVEMSEVVEQDIPIEALEHVDEAFVTSSTRDVHPVAEINGRPLTHCPGPLTAAVARTFAELVARTTDP